MPNPTTYTPDKAFLGIAPETTAGTPVAPTFTLPYEKFEPEDKPKWISDKSLRGSMAVDYNIIQGVFLSDLSLSGPMYVDTFEHLLVNMLGDKTTTGAADPYTHVTSLLNSGNGQPKTHTFTFWSGIPASTGARVYSGAVLSEVTLTWDASSKLCEYTAKGNAWGSAVAGATPTAAPSAVPALASWRAALGLGGPASGGTLVANVESASITMKRKTTPFYTLTNSQQPYVIQRGGLEVTGKMTFIAANDNADLNIDVTPVSQQVQLLISNGTTGAGQRSLQIDMQTAQWETAKINLGKEAILYEANFVATANSTNVGASGGLSPISTTILNANVGTGY